jgi:U3 small nucleolar RNA-associated protein 23
MRQKRTKAYKKLMALYSMSFGFRQPYQVLVDSTFCAEVYQHKMDPLKQLSTVLQGDCKISESLSYLFVDFSDSC